MTLFYYVAVSLDGFVAPLDGSVDWLAPYNAGDGDYGFWEFYKSVDALIEGSKTYEQALTFAASRKTFMRRTGPRLSPG